MSDFVIETHGLTRYFGPRKVVAPLDFAVPRGSICGFLGRNGAGKTTTIRMLLGLLMPTRGTSTVLGHDSMHLPPAVRGRIGYLSEGHHLYEWMTVQECAKFQKGTFPTWNDEIFKAVISHFRLELTAKAGNLSRGQRAGLGLALTLAPEPELLILDDPVIGLDTVARRSLLQSMIYVMQDLKHTILFSSHQLYDVERVADHVIVLDGGVLRANCQLDTFRTRVRQVDLHFSGPPPQIPPLSGLLETSRRGSTVSVVVSNYTDDTERQLRALGAQSIDVISLSLEDAFISYLGERTEKPFFLSKHEEKI